MVLQAAQQMRGGKHCSDLQPSGGQCSLRGKTKPKQLRDGPGALVSVPNMPLVVPAGCSSLTLLVLVGVHERLYLVPQSALFFAGSSEGSIAQNYERRRK